MTHEYCNRNIVILLILVTFKFLIMKKIKMKKKIKGIETKKNYITKNAQKIRMATLNTLYNISCSVAATDVSYEKTNNK